MSGTASGWWKALALAVLEGVPTDISEEVAKRHIGNKGPLHRLIQLALRADLGGVDMAAIEQILQQVPSLLEPVTVVSVPALTAFDVAVHFVVTPQNKRKDAEVLIGWMNDNAQRLVGARTTPEPEIAETTLRVHTLRKASVDGPILAELGDQATTTWAQMYEMMRRQGRGQEGDLLVNGWANIFYIPDIEGQLWAVSCYWISDDRCWRVYAYPVAGPYAWYADSQVVSR